MMRLFYIFIIVVSFINADYLYDNKCVNSLVIDIKDYCYTYTADNIRECTKDNKLKTSFESGYSYIDGSCVVSNYKNLGITETQYSFNMALMGNLLGFTMLFFLIGIVTKI